MSIFYSWNINDIKWDQYSGTIISVTADYVGIKTCVVGSASTTISHQIRKKVLLNTATTPEISINEITKDDVVGWLNDEFSEKILSFREEIYDVISPKSYEYLLQQQREEYMKDGSIHALGGGGGFLPNDSWV